MSGAARFSPRAVLFDLDELGRPQRPQDEIHRFVGKGIPNLVRRCMTEGRTASETEIDAAVDVFRRHYAVVNGRRASIYPGIEEVLRALDARAIPLAVVTNKAEAFTLPLLERMGIAGYFGTVVSGDTLPVKKPDPAMVRLACERLGVVPAEALMVGDSANDALSAQGAGMPVLLVSYGYSEGVPVDTIECDGLLSDALQLLDHIVPAQ